MNQNHATDTKDTAAARVMMSRSRHRRRDATTTRARRSLPVTTSEVASCLSRKRKKMSAKDEDEEDPSSSPHQNNKKEDAIVELGDRTAAEGTTMKVAGPVAATGRPHTAPAGCPTESPAKMEEPEMDARQNQVVSCEKTTKKTTKRSRILTSTDGIVVGGAGRGGQSARNSGGHSSSSNVLASSYYLYHGHRHTNDGRTCSSSSNPLQDCWSMNHEEEKKYGSRCVNKNIPDINSSPPCCESAGCPHRRDHNSAQSLAISFLNAYGEDYCAELGRIDNEQGERPDVGLILSDNSLQRYLTEGDRVHAIEWMSEVSSTLDLRDSTFHSSVAFLDRLLATHFGMKDNEFHQLALACVFVAAKMIETTWEVHNAPQDFINVSRHEMHTQDLIDLESNLCHCLDYRLHAITPLSFLDRFLHASNPTAHYSDAMLRDERLEAGGWLSANPHSSKPRGTLESLALYFLELATHSTELSMQKPDMLAASAVYLARATFGLSVGIDENAPPSSPPDSLFWSATLEHYTDYTAEELEDIIRTMHELHCDTNHSAETTYVYEKFSTEKYRFVSFIPPILRNDLGFL